MSLEIGGPSETNSLEAISMPTTPTTPKLSLRKITMIEMHFTQCQQAYSPSSIFANEIRRFNLHAAALFPEMTSFREM